MDDHGCPWLLAMRWYFACTCTELQVRHTADKQVYAMKLLSKLQMVGTCICTCVRACIEIHCGTMLGGMCIISFWSTTFSRQPHAKKTTTSALIIRHSRYSFTFPQKKCCQVSQCMTATFARHLCGLSSLKLVGVFLKAVSCCYFFITPRLSDQTRHFSGRNVTLWRRLTVNGLFR